MNQPNISYKNSPIMPPENDFAITRVIVCPIIRNRDNEYLICKMPSNRGAYPGQWGLPGGGVEQHEKILAALQRELREEVGPALVISEIIPWTFRDTIKEKIFADGSKKKIYMIFLHFNCLAENKIIQLNEEFEEYAWVKAEELQQYDLNEETEITFAQQGLLNGK